MAARYGDVTAERLEKEPLSPLALSQLPAAKLTASVEPDAGPPVGKRIRLDITWEQGGDQVSPLGLTAWRFPPEEVP